MLVKTIFQDCLPIDGLVFWMNTDNFCLVFVGQAFLPDFLFAFFPKARFSIAGTLFSAGECLRYRGILTTDKLGYHFD